MKPAYCDQGVDGSTAVTNLECRRELHHASEHRQWVSIAGLVCHRQALRIRAAAADANSNEMWHGSLRLHETQALSVTAGTTVWLLRRGVPRVADGARVDAREGRVAAAPQDGQRSERFARARIGNFRADRHNSASLPDMGWGLHCSGQIVRFAFGPPSIQKYQGERISWGASFGSVRDDEFRARS